MKRSLLKKGASPAAMLAVVSIACLSISQQTEAGVTWLASDDGTDLTLTTDGGSIDLGTTTADLPDFAPYIGVSVASTLSYLSVYNGSYHAAESSGATPASLPDPWIQPDSFSGVPDGHTFGYGGSYVYWDHAFGATPGVITPITSLTISGLTVDTAFGSNLDLGPVVLWTANTGGTNTISVALAPVVAVPEPSSTALLGLGAFGLLIRRKR